MARHLTLACCSAGVALMAANPARADDRAFCAERPGQTTPPCTLGPGAVVLETAVADWTLQADRASRADTLELGSSLLRAGLTPRLEAQVGWTPLGVTWARDKVTGIRTRQTGVGDVTLAAVYGLAGANGPVALQAFVQLPTGGSALGARDWSAGARLPVALDLGGGLQLGLTPEIDAAVNQSGRGRHLAYGGAAGIGVPLGTKVNFGADVSVFRDNDAAGDQTVASAGASLAWQASANTQFDLGGTCGLTAAAPHAALYVGVAHRFCATVRCPANLPLRPDGRRCSPRPALAASAG